mgnify:CR=1 FL=1
MEQTLFNRHGSPVAYIDYSDGSTIYMWNGQPVAYLSNNNTVYGFNGQHIGWFENGIVWSLQGEKCGFIDQTCPVYTKYEPYKSYKRYKPYKSYQQYPRYKPYYKSYVSAILLEQLLITGAK